MRKTTLAPAIALGGLFSLAAATSAYAQCTAISVVPTTINTAGHYCLTKNLSYKQNAGDAISILANDVVLDLGGYKLDNMKAARSTSAVGIAVFERRNVTIRNGVVRGFNYGILFGAMIPQNNEGALVEDVELDSNTAYGIDVSAHAPVVRRNRVISTGAGNPAANFSGVGILFQGSHGVVTDNDVLTTLSGGTGNSVAIDMLGDDGLVVGNRIVDAHYGIYISTAGKYRDNTTLDVTLPFTGGTSAGTND